MRHQYSTRAQFPRKQSLSPYKRFAILERDAHTCCYCGFEAETVDHVVPYTYGGTDDDDNLVACCGICNSIAGNKIFESLQAKREHIRERYGPFLAGRVRRIRKKLSICADCQHVYEPRVKGASAVLCAECYAADEDGKNGVMLGLKEDRASYVA